MIKKHILIFSVCFFLSPFLTHNVISKADTVSQRETVYVPAYSSIFHGDLKWEFNLSITLSIHNVDRKNSIVVYAIDYYNTSGKLIQRFIKNNKKIIKPFETYNIGIKETDRRGGVGANFLVKWYAHSKVNKPIIETVMIGSRGQQGISFTSRGVTIDE